MGLCDFKKCTDEQARDCEAHEDECELVKKARICTTKGQLCKVRCRIKKSEDECDKDTVCEWDDEKCKCSKDAWAKAQTMAALVTVCGKEKCEATCDAKLVCSWDDQPDGVCVPNRDKVEQAWAAARKGCASATDKASCVAQIRCSGFGPDKCKIDSQMMTLLATDADLITTTKAVAKKFCNPWKKKALCATSYCDFDSGSSSCQQNEQALNLVARGQVLCRRLKDQEACEANELEVCKWKEEPSCDTPPGKEIFPGKCNVEAEFLLAIQDPEAGLLALGRKWPIQKRQSSESTLF